jgi:8-oxo-dGTP diphosphatase
MKEILMVSVLTRKNGKFLVLKRSKANRTNKLRWQLPEGKVKKGETLIQALERELREETGLKLIDAKFFNEFVSIFEFEGRRYKLIRKIFKCKVKGNIKLGKEHLVYKWIRPEEARKLKWFKGFEKWIQNYFYKL